MDLVGARMASIIAELKCKHTQLFPEENVRQVNRPALSELYRGTFVLQFEPDSFIYERRAAQTSGSRYSFAFAITAARENRERENYSVKLENLEFNRREKSSSSENNVIELQMLKVASPAYHRCCSLKRYLRYIACKYYNVNIQGGRFKRSELNAAYLPNVIPFSGVVGGLRATRRRVTLKRTELIIFHIGA